MYVILSGFILYSNINKEKELNTRIDTLETRRLKRINALKGSILISFLSIGLLVHIFTIDKLNNKVAKQAVLISIYKEASCNMIKDKTPEQIKIAFGAESVMKLNTNYIIHFPINYDIKIDCP